MPSVRVVAYPTSGMAAIAYAWWLVRAASSRVGAYTSKNKHVCYSGGKGTRAGPNCDTTPTHVRFMEAGARTELRGLANRMR